jgi:hypothetical protein
MGRRKNFSPWCFSRKDISIAGFTVGENVPNSSADFYSERR